MKKNRRSGFSVQYSDTRTNVLRARYSNDTLNSSDGSIAQSRSQQRMLKPLYNNHGLRPMNSFTSMASNGNDDLGPSMSYLTNRNLQRRKSQSTGDLYGGTHFGVRCLEVPKLKGFSDIYESDTQLEDNANGLQLKSNLKGSSSFNNLQSNAPPAKLSEKRHGSTLVLPKGTEVQVRGSSLDRRNGSNGALSKLGQQRTRETQSIRNPPKPRGLQLRRSSSACAFAELPQSRSKNNLREYIKQQSRDQQKEKQHLSESVEAKAKLTKKDDTCGHCQRPLKKDRNRSLGQRKNSNSGVLSKLSALNPARLFKRISSCTSEMHVDSNGHSRSHGGCYSIGDIFSPDDTHRTKSSTIDSKYDVDDDEEHNPQATPECARQIRARMSEYEGKSRVYLSAMQLKALPECFGSLDSLTTLALDQNKFRTIPRAVSRLKNLTVLYLNDNKVAEIQPHVRNMTKLRYLWLQNNKLTYLSMNLLHLPQLRYIHIENNRIRQIPPAVNESPSIRGLWLSNNFIKAIPNQLLMCTQLETLHIDRNNITKIPPALHNMPNLKDLVITTSVKMENTDVAEIAAKKMAKRRGERCLKTRDFGGTLQAPTDPTPAKPVIGRTHSTSVLRNSNY